MKAAKLRLVLMSGLLVVSLMTAASAWARPDPDPLAPPGLSDQAAGRLGLASPRFTDWPLFLSPAVDAIILVALLGWILMMMSRRRREEILLDKSRSQRVQSEHMPLREVTYPSETYAKALSSSRQRWIEEFKSLQDAWSRHDLRPVSGILGPDVLSELELHPAAENTALPKIRVEQADPADSWKEGGKEFVTVHFSGKFAGTTAGRDEEFDEYWTFYRPESAQDSGDTPWVVSSIRRGSRERSLPRLAHGG